MKGRTDKTRIDQGDKLMGITALLEEEYAKKQLQEERGVQAEAVPENSAHDEHNFVVEQTGTATGTSSQKAMRQRSLRREQEAEWVAIALLVVGLIALSCYAFQTLWRLHELTKLTFFP